MQFLGTTTASQIVSCTPLLLCNGIVLLYFAVRGVYITILRVQKKVATYAEILKSALSKLICFYQPLPKQKNIDHCFGHVKRIFRRLQLHVICIVCHQPLSYLSAQSDSTNSLTSKYFYKWDPCKCKSNMLCMVGLLAIVSTDFKYSVRLLSVFTVIFIALFVVCCP